MGDFAGFSVQGLDFYEDLEDDNSRSFWLTHKQVYDQQVRVPMLALLATLEPEFGPGKVFRPYRDLRWSADKTPYKTHQGAFVRRGESTGLYVQIDAAGVRTGGGCYRIHGPRLARYRDAVDDDRLGRELQALVEGLAVDGYEIDGDQMATRPRGTPADHPRLQLLRHRGLYAARTYGTPAWVHTAELGDRVAADWRRFGALVDWMVQHVPEEGADERD
ncbi:MAG: DUF2461 domain-containing protein [Nocardioidaceae bacterium]|nr:DUF2461 domain-containing protein [Nocardioidaceae bacterium]